MTDKHLSDREDRLVDTFEAARMLGQHPGTLRKQRVLGNGCAFHKLGRSVKYSVRDIQLYLAMNRVSSTCEHWSAL